jgi:glycerol-3-phosphate acyltransferase PlsX
MRIALDAMGGDRAPSASVRGAVDAVRDLRDVQVVLVGRREAIEAELAACNAPAGRIEVVHAEQVVDMHESPVAALRAKPNSSILTTARLAAEERVDAAVSAGNTGASVAAVHKMMRRLDGVIRSGIAVSLPTLRGHSILCDAGASVAARPEHLYQYAVMASLYAEFVAGLPNPKVALISVGHEEAKGNDLVKETYPLLKADSQLNFVGNLEGHDVYLGTADVFICDGFVGNVMLKLIEALGMGILGRMQKHLMSTVPDLFSRIKPHWQTVADMQDYANHGGAPLLGINGIWIKCHGASGPLAIANGIKLAARFVENHVNDRIVERLGGARASATGEVAEQQNG